MLLTKFTKLKLTFLNLFKKIATILLGTEIILKEIQKCAYLNIRLNPHMQINFRLFFLLKKNKDLMILIVSYKQIKV